MSTKLDEVVDTTSGLTVIKSVQQSFHEAEEARRDRIKKNRDNMRMYMGMQDFSHKQKGQSREFLPKIPMSAEQMSSFVKRGLVQFGDWFSVDLADDVRQLVDDSQIQKLMSCHLNKLNQNNGKFTAFPVIMSDATKDGLLEALIILKVHGSTTTTRKLTGMKDDVPEFEDEEVWSARIDMIKPEDYYPDPTGRGLYEIFRSEHDLQDVIEMADAGIYDKPAVMRLIDTDHPRPTNEKRPEKERGQNQETPPSFRKRVVIDEFWGDLLNEDGTVAHKNIMCAVANETILIRPPEPNPFWHQSSPFVVAPLIRVPHSVWHKALYDHASGLNKSLNEMFNLMLDGGLSSVWGIKQLRMDSLEDPAQVAGGIPQGTTLAVNTTLPPNAKVLETVSEGKVPQDAMAIFEFLNREFNQSALTNELKLGGLPGQDVKATAIVEASQSQAVTLDGIVSDLEHEAIVPVLSKLFWLLMQHIEDLDPRDLITSLGPRAAVILMRMKPEERFRLFDGMCTFSAHGLTGTLNRSRDFQKFMALMQALTINPMLLQAFSKVFSPEKALRHMMKALNIDPEKITKSPEELERMEQDLQELPQFAALMGNRQLTQDKSGTNSSQEAEVAQINNPLTGMTGSES